MKTLNIPLPQWAIGVPEQAAEKAPEAV